jgi:hypothetical protein
MKNVLCIILLITVALLMGCSRYYGPGNGTPNSRGDLLDWSYPGAPVQKTILYNTSIQTLLITVDGDNLRLITNFVLVNPGDSLVRQGRTYETLHLIIRWKCEGCRDILGYSSETEEVSLPGLYTGKPLIIDDLFLQSRSLQRGYVINYGPKRKFFGGGYEFTLERGEHKILEVPSGNFLFFTCSPIEENPRIARQHSLKIDQKRREYWLQGEPKPFDWFIWINEDDWGWW